MSTAVVPISTAGSLLAVPQVPQTYRGKSWNEYPWPRGESTWLSKRDGDGIAFRKRPKSAAIAGMGGFARLVTLVDHVVKGEEWMPVRITVVVTLPVHQQGLLQPVVLT